VSHSRRRGEAQPAGGPRLYHGGPAGLRGQLLPASVTGAGGDQFGALPRVCLTTSADQGKYYAACRAHLAGRLFGTVYVCEPEGDIEPDVDAPFSWRAESALITGVACHVRAADAPALERWYRKWAPAAFAASDRALEIAEWRAYAKLGGMPYVLPHDWDRSASPRSEDVVAAERSLP
jgi:hypothetical protein